MYINDINDILVYLQLPSFKMACSLQNTIAKNGRVELEKIASPQRKKCSSFFSLGSLPTKQKVKNWSFFPLN